MHVVRCLLPCLAGSLLLAELDRGDGVCRHLNDKSNLCRIYDDRPPICG